MKRNGPRKEIVLQNCQCLQIKPTKIKKNIFYFSRDTKGMLLITGLHIIIVNRVFLSICFAKISLTYD
jgi:hypothetical protein